MIRLLILSDQNSLHTIKWIKGLSTYDVEITLFGLNKLMVDDYKGLKNVNVISQNQIITKAEGKLSKLKYLKSIFLLRKIIRDFKPDILHSHYATSYALLGSLSKFYPFVVSVWGSDIYTFPKKSFVHKFILKRNLSCASAIFSTSKAMAIETKKYTSKEIVTVPFGVDLNLFKPTKNKINTAKISIGILKSLEPLYGIPVLMKSFAKVVSKHSDIELELRIVGSGSMLDELKQLAISLNIESNVNFTGRVDHCQTPEVHQELDIEVYPSISESFGVSVVEAGACGVPVIVSNIGGLVEVVDHNVTGLVVPVNDVDAFSDAMSKLITNHELRLEMGKKGIEKARKEYSWVENLELMYTSYKSILGNKQC
jgi:L-malate glycosyltransferase